jgi:hypothetical protein
MRSVVRTLRMIFIGTILALIKPSILYRIHGVSFRAGVVVVDFNARRVVHLNNLL